MHLRHKACLDVLRKYGVPENIIIHSLAVCDVATYLAQRLREAGEKVDVDLVASAALLHDVGKAKAVVERFPTLDHAEASAAIVSMERLPEVAAPIARHLLNSPLDKSFPPSTWEDKVIWYADKTTRFRYIGLRRRMWDLMVRHRSEARTISMVLPHATAMERSIFSKGSLAGIKPSELGRLVARRPAGYMESAIGTTYDYSVEIQDMMAQVSAAGFSSVSLAGGLVAHSAYDTTEGRAVLARLAQKTGVAISSVHAPFAHDMSSDLEVERCAAVAGAVMACRAAADVGAPVVIVHPHAWMDRATNEKVHLALSSMREIMEQCPDGVRVAVENLPSDGTQIVLSAILDQFGSERVGFCYDTSHHNLRPREFDFLGEFGSRLYTVHVSDNLGSKDDHQIPGEGEIDWHAFAGRFGALDFEGPFLLEVETRMSRIKESPDFLAQCYLKADWLLALANRLGSVE